MDEEDMDEKLERLFPVFSAIPEHLELMEEDIPMETDYIINPEGGAINMGGGLYQPQSHSNRPGTPIFSDNRSVILNLEQYDPNTPQILEPNAPHILEPPQLVYYSCPKPYNSTARDVWLAAGLREAATIVEMEYYLSDWLTQNEYITHSSDGRHKIEWVGKNGTRYKTEWDIFIKWMVISCIGEIPA